MRRPLVGVALLYAAGILIAEFVSVPPFVLLGLGLAVAVLALVLAAIRPHLLCLLIVLAGSANLALRKAILSPNDLRNVVGGLTQIATVRGKLLETPTLRVYDYGEKEPWRTLARMNVDSFKTNQGEWQAIRGRIAISTPGMLTNFSAGQTLEITGVIRLPKTAVAEGMFDYRAYLAEQGIYYQLQAASENDWQVVNSPARKPLADRFREWGKRALAIGLPLEDESLRLEWALALGWKTALTEEVSEPFIRAATYHIFAVDGLRMAIVFGILFGLLRALQVPRAICGIVLVPAIWFYVALTGWPASAIRATVMLTIIIISWALKRPFDLINSLCAAALIILVWEPQQLFQAGFQLSFFVVLCMILAVPPLHALANRLLTDPLRPPGLQPFWRRVLAGPGRYPGDLLLTSFAAWIGSIPLVAYYFNIITPVSTPANILAVPLCALVLICNLASLLLAAWLPFLAELFNHAGWFFMEVIRVSSQWFADWPKAYFYVPAPGWFTIALYYAVLLAILTGWLWRPRFRVWKYAGVAGALGLWCFQLLREWPSTRLSILPLNGGSAIYVDAPGRRNDLLIDCGNLNSVEWMTKPFLRAQGVNHLPALLLSHGDLSHIGGAGRVDDLFAVQQVCASPVRFRSTAYRKVIAEFERKPGKLHHISRSDKVGAWTILHPEAMDHFPRADDNVLVLAASFPGRRVLLLSDLGELGQKALLERSPDLRADLVVSCLPSQSEALSDALLDAIQPQIIVVTDSEYPATSRMSPKLRERLELRHVPLICTRSEGAVTIEFNKTRWELRTMNGTRIVGSK